MQLLSGWQACSQEQAAAAVAHTPTLPCWTDDCLLRLACTALHGMRDIQRTMEFSCSGTQVTGI